MSIAKKKTGTKKTGSPSWLKRGADAAQSMQREDARQEQRKEEKDRLFRFRLQEGEEASITFLDGDLVDDGNGGLIFDVPHLYEHEVWGFARRGPAYFACVSEEEPCPLCADGNDAYYCAVFTIIDHRGFTRQNGAEVAYSRKLFVAKSLTIKKLLLAAKKRDGLTGWTVEVSRSDSKVARVGDDFSYEEKNDINVIATEFPDASPGEDTDYEKELTYRNAEELKSLGFGSGMGQTIGSNGSSPGKPAQSPAAPSGEAASDDIPF